MSLQDNKNIINQVKSGYMCENKRRNPFFCECIVFFAQNPLFHFNTICEFAVKWYAMRSRLKNFQIAIKLERHKLPRIDPACHSFISIYKTGHNFCFKLLAWNLSNFYDFHIFDILYFRWSEQFWFWLRPPAAETSKCGFLFLLRGEEMQLLFSAVPQSWSSSSSSPSS